MIHTLSASAVWMSAHHWVIKLPLYITIAPSSEPAIKNSTHFFVEIAPTIINKMIKIAIKPVFMSISPLVTRLLPLSGFACRLHERRISGQIRDT